MVTPRAQRTDTRLSYTHTRLHIVNRSHSKCNKFCRNQFDCIHISIASPAIVTSHISFAGCFPSTPRSAACRSRLQTNCTILSLIRRRFSICSCFTFCLLPVCLARPRTTLLTLGSRPLLVKCAQC